MHNCSVATGDKWLAAKLPQILNSATYAAGRTAVFVTWDEDDKFEGDLCPSLNCDHLATLVIAPSVQPGTRASQNFSHYSLLRTTEELLGVRGRLGEAASAPSMASAFHLLAGAR
jgi:hypothetical protein